MFYVTKTYDHTLGLSACFRQHRAKSHCRFLHGYALSFKLELGAHTQDENGWVFDFGGLKEIKQYLIAHFDHKLVIAADDPLLDELTGLAGLGAADALVLPAIGCEAFAQMLFEHVSAWLGAHYPLSVQDRGLHITYVECREHSGNSAIFMGR